MAFFSNNQEPNKPLKKKLKKNDADMYWFVLFSYLCFKQAREIVQLIFANISNQKRANDVDKDNKKSNEIKRSYKEKKKPT